MVKRPDVLLPLLESPLRAINHMGILLWQGVKMQVVRAKLEAKGDPLPGETLASPLLCEQASLAPIFARTAASLLLLLYLGGQIEIWWRTIFEGEQ